MRASLLLFASCCALLSVDAGSQTRLSQTTSAADAARLFEPIRQVLQHPRCQNCHIPGDAPLQYDTGTVHAQRVKRGADGKGLTALQCSACHQTENAPAALGIHAPPGAPNWHLPPANMKMVFKDLNARDLCMTVKDRKRNGNRSMEDFVHHIADDPLVAWGWNPGGDRKPATPPKEDAVAAVKRGSRRARRARPVEARHSFLRVRTRVELSGYFRVARRMPARARD